MKPEFCLYPIGTIRKHDDRSWIEIRRKFADALLGLEGFSHIHVLFWFHENDNPESRGVLQVHPRRDKRNPLTGVFATRSPLRPNLIGLTRCRILSIKGLKIEIDTIDARDKTPLLDIKCHIPSKTPDTEVGVPDWV